VTVGRAATKQVRLQPQQWQQQQQRQKQRGKARKARRKRECPLRGKQLEGVNIRDAASAIKVHASSGCLSWPVVE
jgi:hypothetical protein